MRASVAWVAFHQGTLDTLPSVLLHRTPSLFNRTLLDNSAFVHTNPARGQIKFVEIAIIVRNHHDGRADFQQSRQEFVVEFAPEFWILFGRPFVKQEDWPLFKQADD